MLNTSWRRTAGVAALVTLTALTLGACAAPSGAAAPAKSEKTSAPSADGAPCTKDNEITDDVIGLEQVKDERGVYCHVTWNPSSPDLAWDPTNVDPSVAEFGYTADEAKTARDFALDFIVEDGLDSPLLDNPDDDRSAWLDQRKHLMTDLLVDYFTTTTVDNFGILNAGAASWPVARRDGRPRADEIQFNPPTITGEPAADAQDGYLAHGPLLQVSVTYTVAFYEVSDADVLASYRVNRPDIPLESILIGDPGLADGEDSGFMLTGTMVAAFDGKDFTKIAGVNIKYEMSTASDTPQDFSPRG